MSFHHPPQRPRKRRRKHVLTSRGQENYNERRKNKNSDRKKRRRRSKRRRGKVTFNANVLRRKTNLNLIKIRWTPKNIWHLRLSLYFWQNSSRRRYMSEKWRKRAIFIFHYFPTTAPPREWGGQFAFFVSLRCEMMLKKVEKWKAKAWKNELWLRFEVCG